MEEQEVWKRSGGTCDVSLAERTAKEGWSGARREVKLRGGYQTDYPLPRQRGVGTAVEW